MTELKKLQRIERAMTNYLHSIQSMRDIIGSSSFSTQAERLAVLQKFDVEIFNTELQLQQISLQMETEQTKS